MASEDFQKALERLVKDPSYRQKVEAHPGEITKDYKLTPGELVKLVEVGETCTGKIIPLDGIDKCCCCCCP